MKFFVRTVTWATKQLEVMTRAATTAGTLAPRHRIINKKKLMSSDSVPTSILFILYYVPIINGNIIQGFCVQRQNHRLLLDCAWREKKCHLW